MPLHCTMVNACGRIGGYPIPSYRPQAVGRNSLGFTPMSYAGTGAASRPLSSFGTLLAVGGEGKATTKLVSRPHREPGVESDDTANLPQQHDVSWVVFGWAVLFGSVRALLSDGSDESSQTFDDSSWPLTIIFGWPALYWFMSHGVSGLLY